MGPLKGLREPGSSLAKPETSGMKPNPTPVNKPPDKDWVPTSMKPEKDELSIETKMDNLRIDPRTQILLNEASFLEVPKKNSF